RQAWCNIGSSVEYGGRVLVSDIPAGTVKSVRVDGSGRSILHQHRARSSSSIADVAVRRLVRRLPGGLPRPPRCAHGSDETNLARILVIDDEALIRETIKAMLEIEGHEIALAPHGDEALRQFRMQAFDLVICDLFTVRRDGTETVSA